jgi:hypothetical protein
MVVAVILGSIGGGISLLGAIIYVGRSVFKQVDSTDKNTIAITELSTQLSKVLYQLGKLDTRVTVLEDRTSRR